MNSITKICSVEDCENDNKARGWCGMHYERWKRTGDPEKYIVRRYTSIEEKLVFNTRFPNNLDDCWLWAGKRQKTGHGKFYWKGLGTSAHRAFYKAFVNNDINGLDVDHLCKNPPCVNPSHMEPVTSRINTLRGSSPPALNAAKTHCKYGHEFTPENTWGNKHRLCRTCSNLKWQKWYHNGGKEIRLAKKSRASQG